LALAIGKASKIIWFKQEHIVVLSARVYLLSANVKIRNALMSDSKAVR
jgi:hypothetical protein